MRGESKYHYVDLSLFPEEDDQLNPPPFQMNTADSSHDGNTQLPRSVQQGNMRTTVLGQLLLPQPTADTADFPSPSKLFTSQPFEGFSKFQRKDAQPYFTVTGEEKMDCHYLNTPLIRIRTAEMSPALRSALPASRLNLPGTLSSYLSLPVLGSHPNAQTGSASDAPLELPDIHSYLARTNYDRDVANSLSHLYRSYCIIVIDSFRFCREKPFFHHHSAFNGTMTVPVAKLLANENLAPWIQECDMRMYKKMIRYIAPLVTQLVPEVVWTMFERVSQRLVPHLVGAFEDKCPVHVVVAKIVPAARFCHLLNKLRSANTSANHVNAMLPEDQGRTQMWIDFVSLVDPEKVIEESMPPPECWNTAERLLANDLKKLVLPLEDQVVQSLERAHSNAFANFRARIQNEDFEDDAEAYDPALNALDRWIEWLERLPLYFPKHHPQCLINWHNAFWKSIMTQLGIGGAQSYQAWWYLEAFLSNMIVWLTQMEGFLMDEPQQKAMEEREKAKKRRDEMNQSNRGASSDRNDKLKRKRSNEDVGGEERSLSRNSNGSQHSGGEAGNEASRPQTAGGMAASMTGILDGTGDEHDFEELRNAEPLELPPIETTQKEIREDHQHAHDDSGIGMGEEGDGEEGENDLNLKGLKHPSESWILSDPADADGHVVVL